MDLKHKTILIISPESWGVNFVSKHNYALELHNQGCNVYFLNPPGRKNELSKSEGISIVDYETRFRGINRLPSKIKDILNKKLVNRINQIAQVDSWHMVWTFDPYRFQNLTIFNAKHNVFFSVDLIHNSFDIELTNNTNLHLSTSAEFVEKFKHLGKKITVINHGLADHFVKYKYQPWQTKNSINAVYVGNLLIKTIDWCSLFIILEDNPDVMFTFIGPYSKSNLSSINNSSKIAKLKTLRNVKLIGEVPSIELPMHLETADLFIMCYDAANHKTEVSNPHKVLEYLSAGRVVVANYTAHYKDKYELLEMTEKQKELPKLFKNVIDNIEKYNNPQLQEKRKKFAMANSYKAHVKEILELLEK